MICRAIPISSIPAPTFQSLRIGDGSRSGNRCDEAVGDMVRRSRFMADNEPFRLSRWNVSAEKSAHSRIWLDPDIGLVYSSDGVTSKRGACADSLAVGSMIKPLIANESNIDGFVIGR